MRSLQIGSVIGPAAADGDDATDADDSVLCMARELAAADSAAAALVSDQSEQVLARF